MTCVECRIFISVITVTGSFLLAGFDVVQIGRFGHYTWAALQEGGTVGKRWADTPITLRGENSWWRPVLPLPLMTSYHKVLGQET